MSRSPVPVLIVHAGGEAIVAEDLLRTRIVADRRRSVGLAATLAMRAVAVGARGTRVRAAGPAAAVAAAGVVVGLEAEDSAVDE